MAPASDPTAVVDAQLRVHGIDRLRVADASVMPAVTSGNTYAPALMIGAKAADLILGRCLPPAEHIPAALPADVAPHPTGQATAAPAQRTAAAVS